MVRDVITESIRLELGDDVFHPVDGDDWLVLGGHELIQGRVEQGDLLVGVLDEVNVELDGVTFGVG